MAEPRLNQRLSRSPAGMIAGGLVIVGVVLWMFVSKALLLVAGLGAFGPGILREFGWLKDHDEYQRLAAHRAGYHAYLVGGIAVVLVASGLALSGGDVGDADEWVRFILIVMWGSWMFSALMEYWGARKTASRILMTFGSFWALFVIASLVGDAHIPRDAHDLWLMVQGMLAGTLFVAPFFVLAWTSTRWPRRSGGWLLAIALVFTAITAPIGGLDWSTILVRDVLLIVPLIATGIALLREPTEPDEGAPAPDPAS